MIALGTFVHHPTYGRGEVVAQSRSRHGAIKYHLQFKTGYTQPFLRGEFVLAPNMPQSIAQEPLTNSKSGV